MIIAFLVLLAIAGVIFYFLLKKLAQKQDQCSPADMPFAAGWVMAGLAGLFLSGWPIWVAGLQVLKDATSSRFTLPFIPGACLLMVGLIGLVQQSQPALGNARSLYRGRDWLSILLSYQFVQEKGSQTALMWQMSERMPGVKAGTVFVLNDTP